MFSIGLMSGTSMDGIDCALIQTDGTPHHVQPITFTSLFYDRRFHLVLKASEYLVRKYNGNLTLVEQHFLSGLEEYAHNQLNISDEALKAQCDELCHYLIEHGEALCFQGVIRHSTELHAQAVKTLLDKVGLNDKDIAIIGYHGQTLYHRPQEQLSIIIGDGQYLANLLNIAVVCDFRANDIAQGGQGAPFAPIYHQALAVRDGLTPLCIVNCGGIANISIVPDDSPLSLLAFDSGPGNGLIDQFVRLRTHGKHNMDGNGEFGKHGRINDKAFEALYMRGVLVNGQNYLVKAPPKSLDIGDLKLVPELDTLSLEDGCRTLESFTADTIVQSLKFIHNVPTSWILAGGGWHNPVILDELNTRLHQAYSHTFSIKTADEINWNGQALEAQIFAYLAVRHLKNLPLSYPGTTSVKTPVTGGQLFTAQK
jgi:anhydro-N-acetylmuramic acid kinase